MNNESIRQNINDLNNDLLEINSKIEHIRNICSHNDYKISLHDFGQFESVQQICLYCGKVLGEPTNEEIDNWFKK